MKTILWIGVVFIFTWCIFYFTVGLGHRYEFSPLVAALTIISACGCLPLCVKTLYSKYTKKKGGY